MAFREDFMWGASTADFQIEGAYNADGKGPGIWDALSAGRIARGETGEVAADHYNRYKEDVALMKQLGLKHYRFSISWPRVMPEGTGKVNERGLAFYVDLVDELLRAGIEPLVTLYHWNMPQALYERGGWLNAESSAWFEAYTKAVVSALGERVRFWLTFNEPQMFTFLGCQIGIHAPFAHYSEDEFLAMTKNILLAHGKAVKVLREALGDQAKISFSPTGDCHIPENDSPEAVAEAYRKSLVMGETFLFSNTWWADPIFFGRFCEEAKERFGERMFSFTSEEWALVSQPLDFFAYNVYQSATVFKNGREVNERYEYPGCPKTAAGWCVTPEVLYWTAKFWHERYKLPVMVTENGCALGDWICEDGRVHDAQRIDFLTRYLRELKRAADEGVDILGYTYWALLDSLEWAGGYDPRYGLVYVDFKTLRRTIKDAGYWYRDMIRTNGEGL